MIIGFIGGVRCTSSARRSPAGARFGGLQVHLILTFASGRRGAALAPWISRYLPVSKWFGRAVVGFGLAMLTFAFLDIYALSLLVIFAGGLILAYLLVTAYTLLHKNPAEEVRGRVFAALTRSCERACWSPWASSR
jgi:hypothetical protein